MQLQAQGPSVLSALFPYHASYHSGLVGLAPCFQLRVAMRGATHCFGEVNEIFTHNQICICSAVPTMALLVKTSSLLTPRLDPLEPAPSCSPPPSLPTSPIQMPYVPSSVSLRQTDPWAYFGLDCSAKSPVDSVLLDLEDVNPNFLRDSSMEPKQNHETTYPLNKRRRNTSADSFVDDVLLGLESSQRNHASKVGEDNAIKQLPAKSRMCPLDASLTDMEDGCLESLDQSWHPQQTLATNKSPRKRQRYLAFGDPNCPKSPVHRFADTNTFQTSSQSSSSRSVASFTDSITTPISKRQKHSAFEGIRRAKIKVIFPSELTCSRTDFCIIRNVLMSYELFVRRRLTEQISSVC